MSDFMTTYFGPLNKEACNYFLFFTMLFFVMLVLTIIMEIVFVFKNFQKLDFRTFTSGVLLLFNSFLAYFVNRLLYSMCSKSLA